MGWRRHYTGIDCWDSRYLYMHRDSKTKKIQFIRLQWRRSYLGVFLGRTNHCSRVEGFELFGNKWHMGWIYDLRYHGKKLCQTEFSGSMAHPWTTVTFRFWHFFIGRSTPAWMIRRKERQFAEYWENCPGPDDQDEYWDDSPEPEDCNK